MTMRTDVNGPGSPRAKSLAGAWVVPMVLAALLLTGCGGSPHLSDPLGQLRDPTASVGRRVAAAEQAWDRVREGEGDRTATRETMKSLAWSRQAPVPVRLACLEALLNDPSPSGEADARQMASMLIWREPLLPIVEFIATTAADRGWTEFTPSLVRSYAQQRPRVRDADRPERAALARLHPDRPVAEVVFGIFLRPEIEGGVYDMDWSERTRMDAWDLLQRLDPDGRLRGRLLEGSEAAVADAGGLAVVQTLRAGLADLRVVPKTSDELRWLIRLRDTSDGANAAWWREAARAIARLDGARGERLELRHVEAVRWASAHRSDWLDRTREDLLAEIGARTSSRDRFPRRDGVASFRGVRSESLEAWSDRMSWADALTVLVVDDALRDGGFERAIFEFAELDREDTTTEYGGTLEWAAPGRWRLSLYPPRASDRRGDDVFVASAEMIEASDRALAHFHLHAQRVDMRRFAGPSEGDFAYAARSGRTCVVFTSIDRDTMNLDVFTPDGVVIDLGTYTRPGE
ncbi:MAG: hypothetical protein EA378_10980 [Phycisphaerales bacterium]|nr:MAG: hypothetical protein EA378_10980 [Phycisphaerales bacterium]